MGQFISFLSDIMPLLYVILGVCTLFIAYMILKYFGVMEVFGVNIDRSSEVIKKEKSDNKKREREKTRLEIYTQVTNMFRGILLPPAKEADYKYYLGRLKYKSDVLNRSITPEEFVGKKFLILCLGVIILPLGVFFSLAYVFGAVLILYFFLKPVFMQRKIRDEDEIIDLYFIDLYLLLYSKLRQGSKARLSSVVESYVDTLHTSNNAEMKRVMLGLAEFLLNNLSMYPDHEAVPLLRERYKSATIVNFCNVASQALQGIDNTDTLLTFKMALVEKKAQAMRKTAQKLRIKGERSIYLIYVLLFIFIGMSWASKVF